MSHLAFAALCALVIATPFETRAAVVALPFQQLTLTEIVWLGAALIFAVAQIAQRRALAWRTPVTTPWLVWTALMLAAALAADLERANALKTTGRLIVFGFTALMVSTLVTNATRMAVLLGVASVTGLVVAAFAMLEVWQVSGVVRGLDTFRDGVRVVGGQVRASSTLQYPTITAMYLELVLCGALGVLLWIGERRGWRTAALAFAGVAAIVAGLALTLTRAAMLAAMAGVLIAAWWRYRHRGPDRGFLLVATSALCLAAAPALLGSSEVARARWTTDGRQGWYRASFDAPPSVTGRPGELTTVPVTVANHGRITWSTDADPPFHISYHWVRADSPQVVAFDGARTSLPSSVRPGASITVPASVRFPQTPGHYRIAWDVVQEGRLWFVGEPGALTSFTRATVAGERAVTVEPRSVRTRSPETLPNPLPPPGRPALWRAALRMVAERPWLGVGPDNFRLRYGPYLGLTDADERVHSNNLYLEVLAGGGAFAFAAFAWFLIRTVHVVRAQRRRLAGQAAALYTGVAAAGIAYLVHGCLDSFMTFTPTAFASAVILGLALAPTAWSELSGS